MKKISNFAVVFTLTLFFGLPIFVEETRRKSDNLKTNIIN